MAQILEPEPGTPSPLGSPLGSPTGSPIMPRFATSTPMRREMRPDSSDDEAPPMSPLHSQREPEPEAEQGTPIGTPTSSPRRAAPHTPPPLSSPAAKKARLDVGSQKEAMLSEYRRAGDSDEIEVEPKVTGAPRLVLRQLVLKDFKSYAGTQIVGPFNDSFSAVVGANGSGKSNVIDSLLFVFGFRSTKLRHTSATGLIHSSDQHQPDSCTVEVHFCEVLDNEDGTTTEQPHSKLVVARRVDKNAQNNAYLMNGRKCTKEDMTRALLERGIDLTHKRFLILQGEVESIAMMKPKGDENNEGLLEYLEDIIGTSKYVGILKDIDTQFEAAHTLSTEYEREYTVAQGRHEMLNRARLERRAAVCEYNKAQAAKYKLFELNAVEAEERRDGLEAQTTEAEAELKELGDGDKEARAQLIALGEHLSAAKDKRDSLQSASGAAHKRAQTAGVEIAKRETALSGLASRTKKTEGDLKSTQQKIGSAETWLDGFDAQLAEVENQQEYLGEKLEAEEGKLASIRAENEEQTAPFLAEIEQLQASNEPTAALAQEAELTLKNAEKGLKASAAKLEASKKEYANSKSRVQSIGNKGEMIIQRKRELSTQLKATAEEEPLDDLVARVETLRAASNEAQSKLQEARAQVTSVASQGKIADSLTKFAREKGLSDFYGRLGALGSIPPEYDVAVSTACPRLDNFVCGSVATAQRCVEHLRVSKVGRATFMSLDKLSAPQQKNAAHRAPRLFDLITKREPKFDAAFFYATGQTLVTADLASARQAAFSGPRVKTVSKQGEVVDVSGAMTGGGRASRGRMGATITAAASDGLSQAEVDAIKRDADAAHAKFKAEETDLARKRGLRTVAAEARRDIEQQLQQTQIELDNHASVFGEHKARLAGEKAALAELEQREAKRVEALQGELERARADLETHKAACAQVDKQVEALRERILTIGGTRLRESVAIVRDLGERIGQFKAQEKDMRAEKRRLAASLAQDREDQARVEAELVRLQTESKTKTAELEQLRVDMGKAEEEAKALDAEVAAAEESIAKLSEQTQELEETVSAAHLKAQELEVRVANLKEQVAKVVASITKTRSEQQALKLESLEPLRNLVPGEEDEQETHIELTTEGDETRDILVEVIRKSMEAWHKNERNDEATVEETLEDYKEHVPRYLETKRKYDDQQQKCLELREKQERISLQRRTEFMAGFSEIRHSLRRVYRDINSDGQADLEFVNTQDPFQGIEFTVQPPGKAWKNISNLSGGEKTLSSLSLVFSLHQYRPTPLYVMDEIDAALDIKNVDTIARHITSKTRCGQFVVISLRSHMYEKAQRMIGVYKWTDKTQCVTLDP